jgi:hypothetical protein
VGNLSTDFDSTNDSLAAAGTTCQAGDLSTYFWPVVRDQIRAGAPDEIGDPADNNVGRIVVPRSANLQFRGSPTAKVVAMPRFIRIITGDAKSVTNGPANAKANWTCQGFADRSTTKYPLCPNGRGVQRILDFPSCWNGVDTDSANHRTHVVFPDAAGACPTGTKAIPQLRMTLTFDVSRGRSFALDSFPEQLRNPITDHGDFVNVMPDSLMTKAVDCINSGKRC